LSQVSVYPKKGGCRLSASESRLLWTKSSLGQYIFVDRTILHNQQKVFVGVFDELDVFQRIAIDQQQIRKGALFDDTKFAGIGIDKPGKCHQLTIVCGGYLERLGRRVPADHLGQYRTLPAGNLRIEQNI